MFLLLVCVASRPLPPQRGLCVEPRNADLKKNLKEIEELIRADKVNTHLSGRVGKSIEGGKRKFCEARFWVEERLWSSAFSDPLLFFGQEETTVRVFFGCVLLQRPCVVSVTCFIVRGTFRVC